MTNFRDHRWLLGCALAAAMFAASGRGLAQAQQGQGPNEPRPGTKADLQEDRQEAQQLKQQIQADRAQLQSAVQQFGSRSPQARAARRQLRLDRQRMERLRRNMTNDRRIRQHRHANGAHFRNAH